MSMKKKDLFAIRKTFSCILALCLLCTYLVLPAFAQEAPLPVVAEWKFDQDSTDGGSLKKGDLVFRDLSGNGNNLEMNGKGGKYLSFTEDRMYDGTNGSLNFDNPTFAFLGGGANFITAKNAPINKEQFENGYTIEFIYQLPDNFAENDAWMGLMARKGQSKSMTEKSGCSTSLAVSNCKELQFLTANREDNYEMDAAWSVSMDNGGVWYHIAIVCDNESIRTYVNGCEAFRDYVGTDMKGIYADPSDGRFVIGGYDTGFSEHFGRGIYQQVRITGAPLEREDWLIQNPEQYLGQYGINEDFRITAGGAYNIVLLPDIQNSVEFRPEVVNVSAQWLVDHQEDANIASVISLGDNVNTYSDQTQWDNALAVLKRLPDNKVPLLVQPGNHDYGDNYYLDTFGPEAKLGKELSKQGVHYSPSGYSSYLFFDGGSYRYLVLSLSMYHIEDETETAWFEQVLKENPNVPTIVTSHNIPTCDAASPEKVHLSENGKIIWNMVKKYNQVFMMVGGHYHGAGEEILTNDNGNQVITILADYQFAYNGGNGFFKFAEFDEAHNQIKMSTYSPYASQLPEAERTFFDVNYMAGPGNYSVFNLDFAKRFAGFAASTIAEQQSKIVQLVKDIDGLMDGVSAKDAERITALNAAYNSLPAEIQADFANISILQSATELVNGLVASGSAETVKPVDNSFQTQLKVVAGGEKSGEQRTTMSLKQVLILIGCIAIGVVLLLIILIVTLIIVKKKKKQKMLQTVSTV